VLAAGLLPDEVVVTHQFGLEDYRSAIETAIDKVNTRATKVIFAP
jgi:threonine dehydrogenase-like Zn-dependent dehydrogenase